MSDAAPINDQNPTRPIEPDHHTRPIESQPTAGAAAYPPQVQVPVQPVYYAASIPTNGMAIASMVLGIIWIYWIGSILAVIFGHVALKQIEQTGHGGRGMAVAGLVLGYIGVGILAIVLMLGVIGATATGF